MRHPGWDRTCRACEAWSWRSDGTLIRTPGGDAIPRTNPDIPTPCMSCPKVPAHLKAAARPWKELRKHAREMTDGNRLAYRRYLEWKAVGVFPDDAIVRWVAGIVRDEEDAFMRDQQQNQTGWLELIALKLAPPETVICRR